MATPSKQVFRATNDKSEIFFNWTEFGYEIGFDMMNAGSQVIPRGIVAPLNQFAYRRTPTGFFRMIIRLGAYLISQPIIRLSSLLGTAVGFIGGAVGYIIGALLGAGFASFGINPPFPYFSYLSHYGNDNENLFFQGTIGKFLFEHQIAIAWTSLVSFFTCVALSGLGIAVTFTPFTAAFIAACSVMGYFLINENIDKIKKIYIKLSHLVNKGIVAINKRIMSKQVNRIQEILTQFPEPFTQEALAPFTDTQKLKFIPQQLEREALTVIKREIFLKQLEQTYGQEWVAGVLRDLTNPILAGFRGVRKDQLPNCNLIEQRVIRNYFGKMATLRDSQAGAFYCKDYPALKAMLQYKPWVNGYFNAPSDFSNVYALQAEDIIRANALNVLDNWEGDRKVKILLKQILTAHPGELIKHDKYYEVCVKQPLKIFNSQSHSKKQLNIILENKMREVGLGFSQEISKRFDFLARKKAALTKPHTLKRHGDGHLSRNKVFFIGVESPAAHDADLTPTLVLKEFVEPQLHQQEIAGTQMAELLGFAEVTLSEITAQSVKVEFDKVGNIVETQITDEGGRALPEVAMQAFKKATTGQQLWDDIFPLLQHSWDPVSAFLSQSVHEQPNPTVEKLLSVDLRSLQLAVIKSIVLGEGDQNPGNTLLTEDASGSGKQKIITIDHEDIMPEDNFNIDKTVPLVTGVQEIPARIKNVFPFRCWLLGLPAAKQPLLPDVIEHCLQYLDLEIIKHYHQSHRLFSTKQVQAQIERIKILRRLLENAKKSPELSVFTMFNHFAKNHPSFHKLKNEHGICDFLLYMQLGLVSGDQAEIQQAQVAFISERSHSNNALTFNFSNRLRNHPHLGAIHTEHNVQLMKQANNALRNHMQLRKLA